MDTTAKGNALENRFYQYLLDQKNNGDLIYGLYPAVLCEIRHKPKYRSCEASRYIEFDVAIELRREGADNPHLIVIFECKNYTGNVPETEITDFSDKLSRIGRHNTKGVVVISSKLQSGAQDLAKIRKLGIVKFNENGLEAIIAERRCSLINDSQYIHNLIFEKNSGRKPLKISAFYDGSYFDSIQTLIGSLSGEDISPLGESNTSIPFVSDTILADKARSLLLEISYKSGPVDLEAICSALSIDVDWSKEECNDEDGYEILGKAEFKKRKILIYSHQNVQRERFTLAHEIGHFYLGHDYFLRSESIVEADLSLSANKSNIHMLDRIEFQANTFASFLLLPEEQFRITISYLRKYYNIRDRGHGYIYVDDQRVNQNDFYNILNKASLFFEVSRQVVEIRLNKLGMVNDNRK